ncbi:MAG: TonB-dependent receptor [Gammaproteobacteria bacterium]|nr:TonB-dependent receptor [Gammaproteobacteria bacterium]
MRHCSLGLSSAFISWLALAISFLAATGASDSVRAASPGDAAVIEEIVVTARKREESLQDVPLSVSAFNESAIENAYGDNIGEFSKMAPNVTLARQPYAGNALFAGMRGIVFGDLEKSFDPAVGVVIDGVPLVTNTGALIDTFDLESVEILRGPQGTLFGRNTIAGVVNARRTRPTGEFGLRTQFRYGAHNETDVKAVLNFPLGDTLAVKMAAFYDKGDGFQEQADFNLATGEVTGTGDDIPGEDTINFYTSILWEPTEDFEALLTFERIDDESTLATPVNLTVPNLSPGQWGAITGAMFANFAAGVPPAAAVGGGIGSALVQGGNFCDIYGSVLAPLNGWVPEIACAKYGLDLGESNGYKYSVAAQLFNNSIEQTGYTLELNYDLGDLRFTSVTGYKEEEELLDEDNLGAPVYIFHPWRPQEYDQFSTELRVASDFGGKFDFVGGAYYVESEYFITASVYVFGNRRVPGAMPSPDGDAGQKLNAFALYGEGYYQVTDDLRLTVGGRWTREEKDFFIFQRVSGDASGLLPPTAWGCGLSGDLQAQADAVAAAWIGGAPTPQIAEARAAGLACNSDGKESWTEFTPRVSLDYAFSDDDMVYASWSRGFRSGGFNGRATTPSSIGPYDPEQVDSFEIGLRSMSFDDRLVFNATLFRAIYKDKHESEIYQFGAATETVVNNAAKATINGLEIESQLALTDKVQLRATVGMIDGKYDKFLAPDRLACQGISRAACPRVDRSDDFAFGFQPDWNFSAGLIVTQPLNDGWGGLTGIANYAWADKTVGNFGQPDPLGLGRNEFPSRGELDLTLIWDRAPFKVAAYVKDVFHKDNYLATSVDVGVFWFGAVAVGRTWGLEITHEL